MSLRLRTALRKLGSLSNHDNDGTKNAKKIVYLTMKNNSFARFAQAIFISVHFADVIVLSTKWNDLFCNCGDEVSMTNANFVFLSLKGLSCSNLVPG